MAQISQTRDRASLVSSSLSSTRGRKVCCCRRQHTFHTCHSSGGARHTKFAINCEEVHHLTDPFFAFGFTIFSRHDLPTRVNMIIKVMIVLMPAISSRTSSLEPIWRV